MYQSYMMLANMVVANKHRLHIWKKGQQIIILCIFPAKHTADSQLCFYAMKNKKQYV